MPQLGDNQHNVIAPEGMALNWLLGDARHDDLSKSEYWRVHLKDQDFGLGRGRADKPKVSLQLDQDQLAANCIVEELGLGEEPFLVVNSAVDGICPFPLKEIKYFRQRFWEILAPKGVVCLVRDVAACLLPPQAVAIAESNILDCAAELLIGLRILSLDFSGIWFQFASRLI